MLCLFNFLHPPYAYLFMHNYIKGWEKIFQAKKVKLFIRYLCIFDVGPVFYLVYDFYTVKNIM